MILYHNYLAIEFVKTLLSAVGVGLLINENYKYRVLERSNNSSYQALWIEILLPNNKKNIRGIVIVNTREL